MLECSALAFRMMGEIRSWDETSGTASSDVTHDVGITSLQFTVILTYF